MKRIIVCCDGTWNKPGNKDRGQVVKTNVQKLYESVTAGESWQQQVKFYGQGVGTAYSLKDHFLGGGTGLGIDANIQDAYKFIMWNYSPGDHIYLFGFSRGAYTVRSLAGLIRNCGIMKPDFLDIISEAYHLYRDRTDLTHPDSDLMKAFKKSYGTEKESNVYFMGVWDTVGSLGIPIRWFDWLNKKYNFHDVKLSSSVKYAYHALAIDERRKIFEPSLWEISADAMNASDPQICQQVWFPGVHSNVGGGYLDCGLSDITLHWMIDKANATGLEFDKTYVAGLKVDSCGELRNSITGLFKFLSKKARDINNDYATRTDPETGKEIKVKVIRNESINYTCFERRYKKKNKYSPKNIDPALKHQTPFDPTKDKWEDLWKVYIKD